MNDLSYTAWMRFQKSFFRHQDLVALARENIEFFTKAVWPDGKPSRTLILGISLRTAPDSFAPRIVDSFTDIGSLRELPRSMARILERQSAKYDFVLVNLLETIDTIRELTRFIAEYAEDFFSIVRRSLNPGKYCCLLTPASPHHDSGFPAAWSVALSGRRQLRLRDEKIGLINDGTSYYYSLYFQADDDKRPAVKVLSDSIQMAGELAAAPSWIIPKPPPRKKHEILHPAKFPETLVEEFLRTFTKEGDTVFDPMVGTGSVLVAAGRMGRSALGIDLIEEFVEISRRRAIEEQQQPLFRAVGRPVKREILQGDSSNLDQMPQLRGRVFDYCITSPPYWSVLQNRGSEYQRSRRQKGLPLTYSQDDRDLGNIPDYDLFVDTLERIYGNVARRLKPGGFCTIVVKNVKRDHISYPLAWDLALRLARPGGPFQYAGVTLWCQDDITIKPFAVGIHWVSNVLHHYCLHFKKSGR